MKIPLRLLTTYVYYKDPSALTILEFCWHTTIKLMVWLQHKKNLIACILYMHPSDLKPLLTTFRQLSTQWVCIFHLHFSSTDFCYTTLEVSIITLGSSLRSQSLQRLPCWHSHSLLNHRVPISTQKAPTQGACSTLKSAWFMVIYTNNSASLKFQNTTKLPLNLNTLLCFCWYKASRIITNPGYAFRIALAS